MSGQPSEGLVSVDVELLVAEEDNAVIEQCLTDFADHATVEVLCDVNAADLGEISIWLLRIGGSSWLGR